MRVIITTDFFIDEDTAFFTALSEDIMMGQRGNIQ